MDSVILRNMEHELSKFHDPAGHCEAMERLRRAVLDGHVADQQTNLLLRHAREFLSDCCAVPLSEELQDALLLQMTEGRFAVDYQSHVKGCGIEVFEAEPVIGRKEEIEFDSLEAELEYLEKELREAREAQSKELPGMRRGFLNSNTPRGPEVMFFIQSIPHVLSLIAVALMCLFVAGRAALVHRARGCNTHASERLLVALGSI
eukprot:gnl/TRDRNA2_/TRDRNA2_177721_c2_seq9.p1 gnl/TRDRNA2_/TRDRNA2_177721_c2~~gnl/TRDRNA2_/TRDRNA2_177721_c2_seq9.p1  ORF type:complete len:204 (+),score=38.21 gnl/TRDRNA2_/TRDRNA2_177721_c2_seq9:151-762(+)